MHNEILEPLANFSSKVDKPYFYKRSSQNRIFGCYVPRGVKPNTQLRLSLGLLTEHKFKHQFKSLRLIYIQTSGTILSISIVIFYQMTILQLLERSYITRMIIQVRVYCNQQLHA